MSEWNGTSQSQALLSKLGSIDPNDTSKALESRLPVFPDPRKMEYLLLKSLWFSHKEVLRITGMTPFEFGALCTDKEFDYYVKGLGALSIRKGVGEDLLKAKFLRNVFVQLQIDAEILWKRLETPNLMTESERIEARASSSRYSAANIAALLRALDTTGEHIEETGTKKIELNITLDGAVVQSYEGRKAAAKSLLDQFTHSNDVIDNDTGQVI